MSSPLQLVPEGGRSRPERGSLITSREVADIIGGVSEAWVRRTVPNKVTLGHSTVRWFEEDVRRWLEESRR